MARRDDVGRMQRQNNAQAQQQNQDQEQEEQGPEREAPETDQSRAQNTLGNSGVAAMMAGADGGDGGGGGGFEMAAQVRTRRADAEQKVDHGGDDVADDGLLTIEDLTESWNPVTRRTDDREKFLEPMPDDDLPPEEDAWLASVRAWPDPTPIPNAWTVDGLLQPSEAVINSSLADWAVGLAFWADPSPAWRAAAMLLRPPAPLLQDPHGRVLLSRVRGSAIGTWILLSSPAFAEGATVATTSFVDFCLELEGRRHRMRAVRLAAERSGKKIPLAEELFAEHHADAPARVRTKALPAGAKAWLDQVFTGLLDLDDPLQLVPDLTLPEPDEEEDDPLGLDAVMQSFTGGPEDRDDALYKSAVQAAERIAGVCARTRVRGAGLAVAIAEVARVWSAGSPTDNLTDTLAALDRDVAAVLQLLVEIARAAQKKQVAPRGLRAGLTRGARQLVAAGQALRDALATIVGGVLPGEPSLPQPQPIPHDPLELARLDAQPADALPWLASLPRDLHSDAAHVFALAAAGAPAVNLIGALSALRDRAEREDDIGLQCVAAILEGAAHLRLGELGRALDIANGQAKLGLERRNGVLIAEATLLAMEAHHANNDPDALARTRTRAGNLLWRLGATGPLSVLARWTPPPVEAGEWYPPNEPSELPDAGA